jgi:hypothetical protein
MNGKISGNDFPKVLLYSCRTVLVVFRCFKIRSLRGYCTSSFGEGVLSYADVLKWFKYVHNFHIYHSKWQSKLEVFNFGWETVVYEIVS